MGNFYMKDGKPRPITPRKGGTGAGGKRKFVKSKLSPEQEKKLKKELDADLDKAIKDSEELKKRGAGPSQTFTARTEVDGKGDTEHLYLSGPEGRFSKKEVQDFAADQKKGRKKG
jgi:hypothetical protein